jgi:DNA-directed RNA polymerase specialized sigma54-like protein
LSYANVAELIHRVTGDRQLSDQKIWQIAKEKAVEIQQFPAS